MANEQPAGYVCNGCGRMARDLEQDMQKLKEGNFLSCCPERKMVPVYTHPAAPVEGLETVGEISTIRQSVSAFAGHVLSNNIKPGDLLCLKSQAEAIFAAEREQKEVALAGRKMLLDLASSNGEKVMALETDNAALTARVKELEDKRIEDRFTVVDEMEKREALETQLAAAQKTLEVYGPYTPTWLGPCVWAGIKEELPPQLVDKEVWISTANPNEVKS